MYHVDFLELPGDDEDDCQHEIFDTLADLVKRVRAFYPNAVGRRMPDGGYLFWKDSLDMLIFDAREGGGNADGMAVVEAARMRLPHGIETA